MHQRLPPSRQHCIVHGLGDIQPDAHDRGAVFHDPPQRSRQGVIILPDDGAWNQSAPVLRDADRHGEHHGVERGQVRRELADRRLVLDPEGVERVRKRLQEALQPGRGDVRRDDGPEGEGGVGDDGDAGCAGVDEGREQLRVVGRHSLVEGLGVCVGERQVRRRRGRVRVRFDGERPDDGVGAGATAAERPVEVLIVRGRGGEEVAAPVDDLPFEGLIGGKAVFGGQQGVAAALGVASCQADGGALASDDG